MATCPCCGDLLPASAEPNELCAVCSRAMDTGAEAGPPGAYGGAERAPVLIESSSGPQGAPIQRPTVVTILACLTFTVALWVFIATVSDASGLFAPEADLTRFESDILIGLGEAFMFFLWGRGLWKLSDWARSLTIVLAGLSLIAGGPSSDWWVRALQLAVMVYLMSPKVRAVFQAATEQDHPIIVDRWLVRRRAGA